jgi:hypothetical protein
MNIHSAVLAKFCPENGSCWFYFEVPNFSTTVNGRTEDKHENPIIVVRYLVTANVMLSQSRR